MKNLIGLLTRQISSSTEQEIKTNLIVPREINGYPTILLVDDDFDRNSLQSTTRRQKNMIFGDNGGKDCELTIAYSVQEALEKIRLDPPDLIISELFFPDSYPVDDYMTEEEHLFERFRPRGIDLIKERNKLGIDIKIIFYSTMAFSSFSTKKEYSIIEKEYLIKKDDRNSYQDLRTNVRLALNLDSSYFNNCSFSPCSGFPDTEKVREPFDYSLVSEEIANYLKIEASEIIQIRRQQQEKLSNRDLLKLGNKISKIRLLLEDKLFTDWLKEIKLSSQSSRNYIWISNNFRNCSEQIIDKIKFPLARLSLMPPSVIDEAIALAKSGEQINETKLEEIKQKYLLDLD